MASIIDIHPHVISTDTARYPLAPLGGTQSTWSRDRPTSYQQMIAEMDAAGVAKSAIVQASTAYGHDNSYVAEAIAARLREDAAHEGRNLMEPIMEASRANVTMGEMCDALREVWGVWRETPVF